MEYFLQYIAYHIDEAIPRKCSTIIRCISDHLEVYSLFSLQYVSKQIRLHFYLSTVVQYRIFAWILKRNNIHFNATCGTDDSADVTMDMVCSSHPQLLIERLNLFTLAHNSSNTIIRPFIYPSSCQNPSHRRDVRYVYVSRYHLPIVLDPKDLANANTAITSFLRNTARTSALCSSAMIAKFATKNRKANREGFTPYTLLYHSTSRIAHLNTVILDNPLFSFTSTDTVGCGVIYPPLSRNPFGEMFFTKNGPIAHLTPFLTPDFIHATWYPMATCGKQNQAIFNFGRERAFQFNRIGLEEELVDKNEAIIHPITIIDMHNPLASDMFQARMSQFYKQNDTSITILHEALNDSIVMHLLQKKCVVGPDEVSDSDTSTISDIHSGTSLSICSQWRYRDSFGNEGDGTTLDAGRAFQISEGDQRMYCDEDSSMIVELSSIESGAVANIKQMEISQPPFTKVKLSSNTSLYDLDVLHGPFPTQDDPFSKYEEQVDEFVDDDDDDSLRVEVASVDSEGSHKNYGTPAFEKSLTDEEEFIHSKLVDNLETGLTFDSEEAIELCGASHESIHSCSKLSEDDTTSVVGNNNFKRKRSDSYVSLSSNVSSGTVGNREVRRVAREM